MDPARPTTGHSQAEFVSTGVGMFLAATELAVLLVLV